MQTETTNINNDSQVADIFLLPASCFTCTRCGSNRHIDTDVDSVRCLAPGCWSVWHNIMTEETKDKGRFTISDPEPMTPDEVRAKIDYHATYHYEAKDQERIDDYHAKVKREWGDGAKKGTKVLSKSAKGGKGRHQEYRIKADTKLVKKPHAEDMPTEETIEKIRRLYSIGCSVTTISKDTSVVLPTVKWIVNNPGSLDNPF